MKTFDRMYVQIRRRPIGIDPKLKWHLWLMSPKGQPMCWLAGTADHARAILLADTFIARCNR